MKSIPCFQDQDGGKEVHRYGQEYHHQQSSQEVQIGRTGEGEDPKERIH
jgi:hypothetical protein